MIDVWHLGANKQKQKQIRKIKMVSWWFKVEFPAVFFWIIGWMSNDMHSIFLQHPHIKFYRISLSLFHSKWTSFLWRTPNNNYYAIRAIKPTKNRTNKHILQPVQNNNHECSYECVCKSVNKLEYIEFDRSTTNCKRIVIFQ